MVQVGLELHPDKTKIVYCLDSNRRARPPHPDLGAEVHTSFTFLGFTFRPRKARGRNGGAYFTGFLPAISTDALNKISAEVKDWYLHRKTNHTFQELADLINQKVAGWMRYYGRYYPSAMYSFLSRINTNLVRWIRKKYKHLAGSRKAWRKLAEIAERRPRMFAHWAWVRHT